MIRKHEAEPIDQNAAAALQDIHFAEGMDAYDAEYQGIVDAVWEKVYEQDQALSSEEFAELLKPPAEQAVKPVYDVPGADKNRRRK
jgi:hypothetical protein